jgi:RNA polymerase sigma-70 factor, ECF subfamily
MQTGEGLEGRGNRGPSRSGSADTLDLAAAYREHRPVILSYLRRRTGDPILAEDLTQEVFLAALRAHPRLAMSPTSLLPWLYTVAERRAIDAARRAQRAARIDAMRAAPGGTGDASAQVITEAVRGLPKEQQRLVLLRLLTGRSFAEIGSALDVDAAVCRARFSRALRALRESLEGAVALVLLGWQLVGEPVEAMAGCI